MRISRVRSKALNIEREPELPRNGGEDEATATKRSIVGFLSQDAAIKLQNIGGQTIV